MRRGRVLASTTLFAWKAWQATSYNVQPASSNGGGLPSHGWCLVVACVPHALRARVLAVVAEYASLCRASVFASTLSPFAAQPTSSAALDTGHSSPLAGALQGHCIPRNMSGPSRRLQLRPPNGRPHNLLVREPRLTPAAPTLWLKQCVMPLL